MAQFVRSEDGKGKENGKNIESEHFIDECHSGGEGNIRVFAGGYLLVGRLGLGSNWLLGGIGRISELQWMS